jgi:hypothetical protein
MQIQEPKTTTYTFSRRFQSSIILSMVMFFLLAAATIYFGIFSSTEPNPNAPLVVALALIFVTLGYYCYDILPKVRATITLSENQIIQRFANGQYVAINWRDVARVRGRMFLGRLEVHAAEPGKVIHIETQIDGFMEIVEFIRQKLKIEA